MAPDDVPVADRMHKEMEGCVATLRIPPQMVKDALAHHRRRRRRRRITVAGAAAAIAAVGIAAGSIAASGPSYGPHAQARLTAAYVLAHVRKNLGASAGKSVIEIRGTGPGQLRWVMWSDQGTGQITTESFDSSGRLKTETAVVTAGTSMRVTSVDFAARTWVVQTYTRPVVPSIGQEFKSVPSDGAAFLQEMQSGAAAVEGREVIRGNEAIRLRLTGQANVPGRVTDVWISAATYLPISISISNRDPAWSVAEDIAWLPPTPGNLRHFTVTIPAGFTQARYPVPSASHGEG